MEAFGLIAWLEETRLVLPLKAVDVAFDVNGDLAEVSLDQIFHQTSTRALDVTYSFPLPAGAAVFRCELIVNDRVIQARVEEQAKAQAIAREMKAAGRRVALVEMERENLFTLSLGNVQPDDLIVVRFAWFQALDHAQRAMTLAIPLTPGVRYIPGEPLLRSNRGKGTESDTSEVPDASRISPPRIDALHPDAALISLRGKLDARFIEIGSVTSATHPVIVRDEHESLAVSLPFGRHMPDRDFVLAWNERSVESLDLKSVTCVDEEFRYAMVRLDAPAHVSAVAEQNRDYYFLVDRSGSMQGKKWECTARALNAFVDELGETDKVWITLFESIFQDYAEAPLPVAELRDDPVFRQLEKLGTTGGTELQPALEHVIKKIAVHSKERDPVIVVITDGQVGNEQAVLNVLGDHRRIPVHTFGIDTAVNDAFLKQLAAQHRGACVLMTPDDDIQGAVRRLGNRLRRPVLTNLTVASPWETTSAFLPDVHAGEHIVVAVKGPRAATSIELTGKPAAEAAHTYRFDLRDEPVAGPRLLWVRKMIDRCLVEDRDAEAIALAIRHNIICRGAAFIAYDLKEKVIVAKEEVYQPSMLAVGGSCNSVLYSMAPSAPAAPQALRQRRANLSADPDVRGQSQVLGMIMRKLVPKRSDAVAERVRTIAAQMEEPSHRTIKGEVLAGAWNDKVTPFLESRQGLMVSAPPEFDDNILVLLKMLLGLWGFAEPMKRYSLLSRLVDDMAQGDAQRLLLTFIQKHIAETELANDLKWIVEQANWEANAPNPTT